MSSHKKLILDQFTKQAPLFSKGSPLRDANALASFVKASKVKQTDEVVDIGCGPGIVTCAFARVAKSVIGLDSTPAMLDLAREEARAQGLSNVKFQVGDLYNTGFGDGSADIVVSRFVLHHLEEPVKALREMRRVARRTVVVTDVTPMSNCCAALNLLEKLRDPSHVAFYAQPALVALMTEAGLPNANCQSYRVESSMKEYLARSFFASDADRAEFLKRIYHDLDTSDGAAHDLRLSRRDNDIWWSHMVSICVASFN
jgi:ubiquinone/menaquinone biosynthesis C-methylase UbiE